MEGGGGSAPGDRRVTMWVEIFFLCVCAPQGQLKEAGGACQVRARLDMMPFLSDGKPALRGRGREWRALRVVA